MQEKNVKPPRIHNIKKLKDIAENTLGSTLEISVEEANFLSGIYIESRYPLGVGLLPHGELTEEDAEKALEIAGRVFAQVGKMLEGKV